jgi:hypothetical protein
MKNRTLFSIFLSLVLLLLLSFTLHGQAPERLTYQGVARNSSGETLKQTNIEIKFGIHAGSAEGELVWEETHAVLTNDFGLFTVMIGDGAPTGGGSLGSFSNIEWATTGYFLNVQMKLDVDFIDMGTSEMLSVPYAMFAKFAAASGESISSYWIDGTEVVTTTVNVGIGTPSPAGKLEVQGDGDEADNDPIFQVKPTANDTVLTVYPVGVRINVEDPPLKGTKGGFAIGGFTPGKGLTNDYMWVTPDSVRIYVDQTGTEGTKGGFAVGGFIPGKGNPAPFVYLTPDNYCIGHMSGNALNKGLYNSFLGYKSGTHTTDGKCNVFIGNGSGLENLSGNWNVFVGDSAGYSNVSGSENVYIGELAGGINAGNKNVMLGSHAGLHNVLGENNVFIGHGAGMNELGSNALYIDNAGKNWDEALIYGNFDTLYLSFFANMDVAGDILANDVTVASDLKWKENIIPYQDALNQVSRLQGVTYDWKVEESQKKLFNEKRQIGLIAQEVEEVIPELVKTDGKGDKSISYSKLTVVLLEALKEQQKMIEALQREVELLKQKD